MNIRFVIRFFVVLGIVCCGVCSGYAQKTDISPSKLKNIRFKPITGYKYLPYSYPKDTLLYYIIDSKEGFKDLFVPLRHPYPQDSVTKINFEKEIVLAVVKRGYTKYALAPQKVSNSGGEVVFAFNSSALNPSETKIENICLIKLNRDYIIVDKVPPRLYSFVENGFTVYKLSQTLSKY